MNKSERRLGFVGVSRRPSSPRANTSRKRREAPADPRAVEFFKKHAGSSYDPKKETPAQGRLRGAKALARAEAEATARGWTVEWDHDQNPDTSWMDDEQLADYESGRIEILDAVLKDESGEVLESLGGVALNARGPRDPYGRVVEAELALKALGEE